MTVGGAATTRRNHCVEASASIRPLRGRAAAMRDLFTYQPQLAPNSGSRRGWRTKRALSNVTTGAKTTCLLRTGLFAPVRRTK